jgi:Domain of unknown function (DUF4278)
MELKFMRATYKQESNCIVTEITQEKGQFMGQTYSLHRPLATNRISSQRQLKYRGVAY